MKQILVALLPVLLFGCFSVTQPPDRCLERQVCAPVDALGCCDGVGTEVSVCEMCPTGTVTETSCRTTGCTMGCETPIACRVDVGAGCCGDAVFTTSCDTCPRGSVAADTCTGDFPSCGCDDTRRIRAPEAAPIPLRECYADLGNGCCGDIVGNEGMCGCAPGSLLGEACGQFDEDSDVPPGLIAPTCFEDLGGGCCGGGVAPAACGMCPAGSISASECAMAGAPEPDPAPILPPGPVCREDLGAGCCGGGVEANICGMCPAGSVRAESCSGDADFFFPGPPTCRVNIGGGCCGEAVAANGCGICPAGSVNEGECIDFSMTAEPTPRGDEPGAAPPSDPARPIRPPGCFIIDDAGCCGEEVMMNTCGECPAGTSLECLFC